MDLVHQLNISSGDTCGSSFQKKPSLPLPLLIRKRDDTIFGQHFPIGSPLTSMCVCFVRMGRLGASRPVGSTNRSPQSASAIGSRRKCSVKCTPPPVKILARFFHSLLPECWLRYQSNTCYIYSSEDIPVPGNPLRYERTENDRARPERG